MYTFPNADTKPEVPRRVGGTSRTVDGFPFGAPGTRVNDTTPYHGRFRILRQDREREGGRGEKIELLACDLGPIIPRHVLPACVFLFFSFFLLFFCFLFLRYFWG